MKQKSPCGNIPAATIILFVAVAALSFFLLSAMSDLEKIKQIPAIRQSLKLQDILSGLGRIDEAKNYTTLVSLREITPADIGLLKERQPVIYNQLPDKNLFEAVLSNQYNSSVFIIYDLEENRILRMFSLSGQQEIPR